MKTFLFQTLALFFLSRLVFSQAICPNANVSTLVTQPNGTAIVSSTCSTLLVKWQGTVNQTYCVSATYFNPITNKKDTAMGVNIACNDNQNCTATIPVTPGTTITWSVQAISNNTASYPVISVLEHPIPSCSGTGITFCGKVLLQGAYNPATKVMNNTLNTLGILQSLAMNQPYNSAPLNYTGTENVKIGFFAANPDIVDWVLVELRDPNAPSVVLSRRAAFVKQNGTLVDTGGTSTKIYFPGIATGSYHVAIRHRNHLGLRTLTPIDFNCMNACYDFTTAGYKAFKSQPYTSPVQMGTVWVMRGGNANVNQNTRYSGPGNDQNQILNIKLGGDISKTIFDVYAPEDINMNGNIRWAGLANDQNLILNIVLAGSLVALYEEQF
jgi:hypothetical protein